MSYEGCRKRSAVHLVMPNAFQKRRSQATPSGPYQRLQREPILNETHFLYSILISNDIYLNIFWDLSDKSFFILTDNRSTKPVQYQLVGF